MIEEMLTQLDSEMVEIKEALVALRLKLANKLKRHYTKQILDAEGIDELLAEEKMLERKHQFIKQEIRDLQSPKVKTIKIYLEVDEITEDDIRQALFDRAKDNTPFEFIARHETTNDGVSLV